MNYPLIDVQNLSKSFYHKGKASPVLQDLSFRIYAGEIIAIVGKSGCGKSTLLRMLAGLLKPSMGEIRYKNNLLLGPHPGIAMVFQSFALLPWLTVLENVELGLEAQGMPKKERRQKAIDAIDIIGLDGFESAYPKELSGGMCQRVGIARSLVMEPELLIMDEPFSSLDVLTAENLRRDLINLWQQSRMQTKAILLVTHNIEEAALMSDRVMIIKDLPGKIHTSLQFSLVKPRNVNHPRVQRFIDEIYTAMTTQDSKRYQFDFDPASGIPEQEIAYPLPEASIHALTGLLEALTQPELQASCDLYKLADKLSYHIDELFPVVEALEILDFAVVRKGDIQLTAVGRQFLSADILARKQIMRIQLPKRVPLARHIFMLLQEDPDFSLDEDDLLDELKSKMSEAEAEKLLRIVVDWARYAEMFVYDYDSGKLSLENHEKSM